MNKLILHLKLTSWRMIACAVLLIVPLSAPVAPAQTVPALVNYQGRLSNPDGSPLATKDYQLTFRIYDSATNAATTNLIWGPQIFDGSNGLGRGPLIPVVQGYFNVMLGPEDTNGLSLASAFNATNRFVEIKVGTNTNAISPRQQILTAPFAFQAGNSAKLAGYDWSSLLNTNDPVNGKLLGSKIASNTITAGQIANGTITAQQLASGASLASNQIWFTAGNAGTVGGVNFLGTTDNNPFEIRVKGQRALLLQPNVNNPNYGPSVYGGAVNNGGPNALSGATIGGGGNASLPNSVSADYATIAGGQGNTGSGTNSAIGGGDVNTASGLSATVAGGHGNSAVASYSTVAGGIVNTANGYSATIGGGYQNGTGTGSDYSFIGGGQNNTIYNNAQHTVIAGGEGNFISPGAGHSAITGGKQNTNGSAYSFIGGGNRNQTQSGIYYATVAGGSDNVAASDDSTIGGGAGNVASGSYSLIAGGYFNTATATMGSVGGGHNNTNQAGYGVIAGGNFNFSSGSSTVVGGGDHNQAIGSDSVVGGGTFNTASDYSVVAGGVSNNASYYGTIPGGVLNQAAGIGSFAAGQQARALHDGTFVWHDSTLTSGYDSTASNQFLIYASGGVGIGKRNPATALDVSGTVTASSFSGSGSNLTSLNGANLSDSSVTWSKFATRQTGTNYVGSGGVAISGDSESQVFNNSGTFDVTNLSVTIATTGRPVFLGLIGSSNVPSGEGSYIAFGTTNSGNAAIGYVDFVSGTNVLNAQTNLVSSQEVNVYIPSLSNYQSLIAPSALHTIAFPGAGTWVYKVQVRLLSGKSGQVYYARLVAYEL